MNNQVVNTLLAGGVAVIPTDTLYGIVCQAHNREAVERVYALKGRSPEKPCIILIADWQDLTGFSVIVSPELKEQISSFWPGPTSIILDCPNPELEYLHRKTNTLAFRWPDDAQVQGIIKAVGPLIAPSANPEGSPPAVNIDMAKQYFGDGISYLDGGELTNRPSTLIRIVDQEIHTLRP